MLLETSKRVFDEDVRLSSVYELDYTCLVFSVEEEISVRLYGIDIMVIYNFFNEIDCLSFVLFKPKIIIYNVALFSFRTFIWQT